MGGLGVQQDKSDDNHSEANESKPSASAAYDFYKRRRTANWDNKLNVINEEENNNK